MIQIEDCLKLLQDSVRPIEETEYVSLRLCLGRIAAEDVRASLAVPPFPRSAVDGYAVRAEDTSSAGPGRAVHLKVNGKITAGEFEDIAFSPGSAVRVMTGAYIPQGYDSVVKQEDTDMGNSYVNVTKAARPWENYCRVGEDTAAGDVVIEKGAMIDHIRCGLLASVGKRGLKALRRPVVSVISTGSELTEPGENLSPGKIYASAGYMLSAAAESRGIEVKGPYLCGDEADEAQRLIEEAAASSDLIITTGAVSVGEKDFIPSLMKEMGAQILFRGADIQPGTPTMASCLKGKIILSLSGNPYAALANFEIYFWDMKAAMTGCGQLRPVIDNLTLADRYDKVNKRRRLIRARAEAGFVYLPTEIHSSSVINNLTRCNCFIDLKAGRKVEPGDKVRIRYIKGL